MLQDRIKGFRRVKAKSLRPHPQNWRLHPANQRGALREALEQIGISAALIAYETPEGLTLIDGHLRADMDPEQKWPVLVLDVDDQGAQRLLASLHPLEALAEADHQKLEQLVQQAQLEGEQLLEAVAQRWSEQEAAEGELAEPPAAALDDSDLTPDEVPEHVTRHAYGVIVLCNNEPEQRQVYDDLRGQGYDCRVVVT